MPPDRRDRPQPDGLPAGGPDRRSLAEMAMALGESVVAGNRFLPLDDPASLWFVESGALDVFLVGVSDGLDEAPFRHVLRLEAGGLAFGATSNEELRLAAKGLPDTVLRRIPAAGLIAGAAGDADGWQRIVAEDADNWVAGIIAAVAAGVEVRPRSDMLLCEGTVTGASGILTSNEGVFWIEGAPALFFGTEDPMEGELVAVAPDGWVALHGRADITVLSSRTLGAEALLSRALPGFHRLAFAAQMFNRRMLLADQAGLQVERTIWRRRDENQARRNLFTLHASTRPAASGGGALMAALCAVGRHEGIAIREPGNRSDEPPVLADLLHASGVRARRIRLVSGERWWRGDSGAILAFRRDSGEPVALLPGVMGRYRLFDPATAESSLVGRSDTATLAPDGYVLYRPLPDDRPLGTWTLLAGAAGRFGADLARVIAAGLAAGVLALAPAAGIGVLLDRVVPSGDGGALLQLTLVLVLLALAAALTHVLRGTAVMRIEGRLAARATAALWDRLLRLQTSFYRQYSSGEISMRALAFQTLRDRLSGATGTAVLSLLFLIPSIILVFLCDAALGWATLGIGIAALAVTVAFGVAQMAAQRLRFREERVLAGHLLQLIDCVRKLQAAGAEGSARASWARRYRKQKQAEIRVGILNEHLKAFSAAVPLVAAATLLAVAATREDGMLDVGEFLVAYVASMMFYASIVALGAAFEAIASFGPVCEQVLPILAGTPDSRPKPGPPPVLGGALRFESVSFRYGDDGPLILDQVSIEAQPGEFVAVVGESGAGKSTLIRLALGLEMPTSGAVYYDERDLAHLDPVVVRRQVGAVLQDSGTQIGTVLNNIISLDQSLTADDAWRAARKATVDRDIAAMPMRMHTSMGERAVVVSGGQSQRIRIAQALVRDPRIVLLDEATNWLDRRNQAALMKGIRDSTATRVVVAHRISTIREAHRIYVLKAGRVVQVGRFDELASTDGPFRELVSRQMS